MIATILNFVSTSNLISIHSQSLYKLSMIRFVHKVPFDVNFLITHRLYALLPDNLKNFDTIMCLFDLFVNHVNCCYFYVFFFSLLLFILCRLAKKRTKKKQRQKRTNGQKSLGKILKQ